MKQKIESEKVKDARERRAHRLADEILEWKTLAARNEWPKSLVEILSAALRHEYALARRIR